ncbi:MAG TPA: tol-pal system protein YbgF [Rhizomicrobium sp.]|jgi:tol-pal system protein YbgF|nr:tol-pal system protein YbgF [Rhizomicrobium sp.]
MKIRAAILTLGLMLSGSAITAFPAHAQLFGESDEDKAARLAHEDGQDAQIKQLGDRIQQLEDKARNLTESLSTLTGANEELAHQIQDLHQKIDAQQKDFAYRLCMLSAQQLGAGDQGLNCGGTGVAPAPAAAAQGPATLAPGTPLPPINDQAADAPAPSPDDVSGGPQQLGPQQRGKPPGTLGTLPGNAASPVGPSAPPSRSAQGQYDRAMNLLAKAQYAEANAAFRSYADANPDDHDLSSQAIYWIGDIAYVQHDYPGAARAFAEQIKKYPDSNRSPDSMLKLGQSLLAEGQTSTGCLTLAALKTKYPKAPPATLAAAAGAHKAACR